MLKKLTAREKNLLLILGMITVITLVVRFFIQVQFPQYQAAKANLEQKKQEVLEGSNLAQNISNLEGQKIELIKKRDNLLSQFQINLEAGSPFMHLSEEYDNLNLVSIKPHPVNRKNYYSSLQLDIKIRGAYLSVLRYLEKIETLPTIAEILNLNITQSEVDQVTSEFIVRLYSAGNFIEQSYISSQTIGKYDIFTPLLQVLIPPDTEPNFSGQYGSEDMDVIEQDTFPSSRQNITEEKIEEDYKIYYNFPVR